MEKDSVGNQKLFYKILKTLRKGKENKSQYITSKDGRTLSEKVDIMKRWKEYFVELLNAEQTDNQNKEEEDTERVEEDNEQEEEFSPNEIIEAIKMLKRGKAAGHDGITSEMLKLLGTNGIEMITTLMNKISEESTIPTEWELGIILPIHKKGNKRDCNNYRGVTLLSNVSKIYERLLDNRLKTKIESQLEESQSGFRKGRGIQDHIFTIKQLIEKHFNNDIYVAFIDLQKAFDSVPRELIWDSLKRRGIKNRLRKNIASLYKNTRNYVRTNNTESEEFVTKEGVRQGGVLSPTLFNIILDDVTKEVKSHIKKLHIGYRYMEPIYLTECAFADDLAIWAKNEKELQENLEIWNRSLQTRNLKINTEKTKVMVIGKNNIQTKIQLNDKEIEQVDSFKYLGVTIQKDGKNEAEINNRIESAIKVYYALGNTFVRKKEVSKKTKLTVYNTIYKPILTFGCESWTLTKQQESKIQASEMKYLRGIMGITKRDRIRNEEIRKELEVDPVKKTIERQQLRWFGHLSRMENNRQTKIIWQTKTNIKRQRGRPRRRWDETIAEILKKRNRSWQEAKALAKNKKGWAKFVHNYND